jgi:hypothetical protein
MFGTKIAVEIVQNRTRKAKDPDDGRMSASFVPMPQEHDGEYIKIIAPILEVTRGVVRDPLKAVDEVRDDFLAVRNGRVDGLLFIVIVVVFQGLKNGRDFGVRHWASSLRL